MGIAAYNRGSRAIRAQFDREADERRRQRPPERQVRCSCGCKVDHVIAERRTADGTVVRAWANGDVASSFDIFARHLPRELQNIVMGEVCLYDRAEIRTLVKGARRAWDLHKRAPHRTPAHEVLRLTRVYAQ